MGKAGTHLQWLAMFQHYAITGKWKLLETGIQAVGNLTVLIHLLYPKGFQSAPWGIRKSPLHITYNVTTLSNTSNRQSRQQVDRGQILHPFSTQRRGIIYTTWHQLCRRSCPKEIRVGNCLRGSTPV